MSRPVAALLVLLCAGTSRAEFLPADDWLICWTAAFEVRTRQPLRGLDAAEHSAELRGRVYRDWHARVRATSLRAASLDERGLQVALRWRAPWLEVQGEAGIERGDLPGLPTQSGHSIAASAALAHSRWHWGVSIRQRQRDVPESARLEFALRHRRDHSVVVLRRETRPFGREHRWECGASTSLGPALRVALVATGESVELRWRVRRKAVALSGALALWSELEIGPSLALEWRL